jgi:tyrosinase
VLGLGIRKDQSEMNNNEKANFVNAVLTFKRKPSQMYPPSQNRYDDYVLIHSVAMMQMGMNHYAHMQAHQGPAFLPWHREFIRRFELDLQAIDSRVTLPYWDWTKDNSEQSSIWMPEFMGGNGRESDGRVMDGPFAFDHGDWNLNILDADDPAHKQFLRRRFGTFPNVSTLPTAQQVEDCLTVVPYDTSPWITDTQTGQPQPSFRNRLEGWYGDGRIHNRVHLWVSGGTPPGFNDAGSMFWSTSPNDPVFFLHHCNIDRLWAIWQLRNPTFGYVPNVGGPGGHNVNDLLEPWGRETSHSHCHDHASGHSVTTNAPTVASVLDHHSIGYIYDTELEDQHNEHLRMIRVMREQKARGLFVWNDLI